MNVEKSLLLALKEYQRENQNASLDDIAEIWGKAKKLNAIDTLPKVDIEKIEEYSESEVEIKRSAIQPTVYKDQSTFATEYE